MKPEQAAATFQREPLLPRIFAGLFGSFLGLSLLKFGNPPIMEKWVTPPGGFYEFLFGYPWPMTWAYWLLGFIALVGLFVARWRLNAPKWLVLMPLAWLVWQLLATVQSVGPQLSQTVLRHFVASMVCFYLGLFALGRGKCLWPFWISLLAGFLLVLASGWQQHFGGLEETRRYFFLYLYPQVKELPPEYLKRMSSNRIFATLFYPNALAGALVLLLPAMLATVWRMRRRLTTSARRFLFAALATTGLASLYWSGSKGGWLVMLLLGLIALLGSSFSKQLKITLVAVILIFGLAGFFWKHHGFFEKGATSVVARFDYWRAAVQTATARPFFGTGPGTFSIAYQKFKRPESEPTRLVHNDYLEQASDSGVPGFMLYVIFISGALFYGHARLRQSGCDGESQLFPVWLGVFGWSLQSLFEFGLYVPALAWLAFALMGWLLAQPTNRAAS